MSRTLRDGFSPQTNVVRRDGMRGSLLTVQKVGATSTLDIVQRVKDAAALRSVRHLPPGVVDQQRTACRSVVISVRAAANGVIREAVIAALLPDGHDDPAVPRKLAQHALIIAISFPLSILTSIVCLSALGETINIMTLGGRWRSRSVFWSTTRRSPLKISSGTSKEGKDLHEGILDGAAQIAVPALVSTLCICIVFIPMFFLTGVARYLFIPLAEAVVFAMLASYVSVPHAGADPRDVSVARAWQA